MFLMQILHPVIPIIMKMSLIMLKASSIIVLWKEKLNIRQYLTHSRLIAKLEGSTIWIRSVFWMDIPINCRKNKLVSTIFRCSTHNKNVRKPMKFAKDQMFSKFFLFFDKKKHKNLRKTSEFQ